MNYHRMKHLILDISPDWYEEHKYFVMKELTAAMFFQREMDIQEKT